MKYISKVFLVLAGLLAAPVVNAQIVTYYDYHAWEAAVGSWQLETFENGTTLRPGLSITGPNVQLGVLGGYSFTSWVPADHVMHDVVSPTETTTITWNTPATAMGAIWDLAGPGGPGSSITLTLIDGSTQTILPDYLPNTLAGGFFGFRGFVSETPFTSVTLSSGSGCCQETYEMDNLKYVNLVPEPETYAMMLAGLGLMGFIARRRRQNYAAA